MAQGSCTEKINNNIDRCISSWNKELKKTQTTNHFQRRVSVASVAIQDYTTADGSEGTVFFHSVRHFRGSPLPEDHERRIFVKTGFFKKQQFNRS